MKKSTVILSTLIATVGLSVPATVYVAGQNNLAETQAKQEFLASSEAASKASSQQSSYEYSSKAKEQQEQETKTEIAIKEKYANDNAVEYTVETMTVQESGLQVGGARLPHYGTTTPTNTYIKGSDGNNKWFGFVIDYENSETPDQVIKITISGQHVNAIEQFANYMNEINPNGQIRKNTLKTNFDYFMQNVYNQ